MRCKCVYRWWNWCRNYISSYIQGIRKIGNRGVVLLDLGSVLGVATPKIIKISLSHSSPSRFSLALQHNRTSSHQLLPSKQMRRTMTTMMTTPGTWMAPHPCSKIKKPTNLPNLSRLSQLLSKNRTRLNRRWRALLKRMKMMRRSYWNLSKGRT